MLEGCAAGGRDPGSPEAEGRLKPEAQRTASITERVRKVTDS